MNSEVNYGPSKVVGIVGMGHLPGNKDFYKTEVLLIKFEMN